MKTPSHLGGHANITHVDRGSLIALMEGCGIESMVDLGCGPGGQVKEARKLGLKAVGIDGDSKCNPDIVWDFNEGRIAEIEKFSLCWCVEFLEHVGEEFISNTVPVFRASSIVLVTAAPKGFPGHHHVNCQNQEYWNGFFAAIGFRISEQLTFDVRSNSTMARDFVRDRGLVYVAG